MLSKTFDSFFFLLFLIIDSYSSISAFCSSIRSFCPFLTLKLTIANAIPKPTKIVTKPNPINWSYQLNAVVRVIIIAIKPAMKHAIAAPKLLLILFGLSARLLTTSSTTSFLSARVFLEPNSSSIPCSYLIFL